jgi:5-methylcytosine-specific restriction endonuclease McrA
VSVYISVDLRRQIRAQFGNHCAYCRTSEALSVAIFEFEHIVPLSTGGATVLENLCLSCPTCNRWKANRTTAAEPETRQIVPLFHPRQNNWMDHFAWSEDSTTILGLTPTGRATISMFRMNRPQLVRLRRMWAVMGEHPPELP